MKDVKENKGISIRNKSYLRNKNSTSGITLIALVITIIVLLILSGVAIATLTGENGILTQASKAKDKTTEAEAIERVQVEVLGSYGTDGKIDIENQLNKNLGNIDGLTYNGSALSDSNKITSLPETVTLNGYDIVIDGNGSVTKKVTVADAKSDGTVFGDNTTITDDYGNSITIPKGFKIASDSATDVTGGIVIEDSSYTNTKGSQFVWIPVGTVYTNLEKTESKTIELGRYSFTKNSDGTITTSEYAESNKEETVAEHTYGNAIAKDIEKFKESTSVDKTRGYYIGRYEAGVAGYDSVATNNSSSLTNWTGYTKTDGTNPQIVCKEGQQVWNYVTQNKASELSRNMYDNTLPFTSDLVNSYAWDTAIAFLQTFGTESNSAAYSYQVGQSTNASAPSTTGTGILSSTSKVDKQCNILDMAGNCFEWTTETSSSSSNPCVGRGGNYSSSYDYTSYRTRQRYDQCSQPWFFPPTFIFVSCAL